MRAETRRFGKGKRENIFWGRPIPTNLQWWCKRIGKIRTEPDFVNSQAVSARALVQTLAYPLIQPAIQDLFQESKNSAEIVTVAANEYLPLNTPLIYGVIRTLVLQTRGERSIAIGIMWRAGHSELLPPHDKTRRLRCSRATGWCS